MLEEHGVSATDLAGVVARMQEVRAVQHNGRCCWRLFVSLTGSAIDAALLQIGGSLKCIRELKCSRNSVGGGIDVACLHSACLTTRLDQRTAFCWKR